MSSTDEQAVYIIMGRVTAEENGPQIPVHIMLTGPDDDGVIREALNALASDGYYEAEFDQIGTLTDQPIEEPHTSAYQGALEGEVAIITFEEDAGGDEQVDGYDADNVHPFEALKDWGN